MAFVRDFFSWIDTGAVQYPVLYKHIIELTMPALRVKNLLPEFPLVAGRTATFIKQSGSRSATITEVEEGAEIPVDLTPYTTVVTTPYKRALRERITRETIEDFYIPVVEDQLRRLARRMAFTIDNDVMATLDAGAGTTSGATGKSLGFDGTEFVLGTGPSSFGLGTFDLTAARAKIEGFNLIADTLLINPIQGADLLRLPHFTSAMHYGDIVLQTGIFGEVFGLDVYMSTVVTAGSAYVVSTGKNVSAAFSPLGYFVVKRPLLVDVDTAKKDDSYDVILSTRYSPIVLTGEAIVKVNNLRTS